MLRCKIFCVLLLVLFFYFDAVSQVPSAGNVIAKVVDEKNEAVENATCSLLRTKDSVLVRTALSGKDGKINIENIKPGNYLLRVSHTGYSSGYSKSFSVDAPHLHLELGNIVLPLAVNKLKDVQVDTRKPFIEQQIDKLVVNVENSVLSAGTNMLEVLEKSPGIRVNGEGGISMAGKSGVNVLIDGKRTYLSSAELANFLKSQPASQLEKIEIITNPSSKYDAEGNAGILNLRLKKDKRVGTNGSLNAGYGQGVYHRFNAGGNLNYRNRKINVFGNYAFTDNFSYTNTDINRNFYAGQTLSSVFNQLTVLLPWSSAHTLRGGIDVYASAKTTIGILVNASSSKNYYDGFTDAVQALPSGVVTQYIDTKNAQKDRSNRFDLNFNIKHVIDSAGTEITADLDYTRFDQLIRQQTATLFFDKNHTPNAPDLRLRGQLPGIFDIGSIKIDYVHPIGKHTKLEAGVKSSYVVNNSDVKYYLVNAGIESLDPSRSNYFIFKENINAAYVSVSKELKSWSFQAGLRLEHTNNKGTQVTLDTVFTRNYVQLFPTFFARKVLDRKNTLQFAYSRRIDRPGYGSLNPYRFFLDPFTFRVGNPSLQPQFTDGFSVTHSFNNILITSLNYSRDNRVLADVFFLDTLTKSTTRTTINMNTNENISFSVNASVKPAKWWTSNHNFLLFHQRFSGLLAGKEDVRSQTSFSVSSNHVLSLPGGFSAECNALYNSKTIEGSSEYLPFWSVTMGIQKSVFKQRANIRLSFRDIFHSENQSVKAYYPDASIVLLRVRDTRAVAVTITYRFGKNTVAPSRRRTTGAEDEKKRLGAG
jgi:iron complex outermembrane receptor protein